MIKKFYFLLLLFMVVSIFTGKSQATAEESKTDYHRVVVEMDHLGDELIDRYDPNNSLPTMDGFSRLYFDHYEGSGMELAIAAISPLINTRTEAMFTQLIGAASAGGEPPSLQKTWAALKIRLNADVDLLQNHVANHFAQAFIQAFSILLREGFEALIIITTLLASLRRNQEGNKSRAIYYGVGVALFLSILTAFLFATVLKNLGANREAIEGVTMLMAAAVMFYVSYWLFAKRDAAKWQGFIKSKMDKALKSSNMFALGLVAFLAVYREGAETILFYQALIIGSKGQSFGIFTGFVVACFALLLIYWAIQKASFKMPYRLFFTLTALFLYYMSFSFIGSGILELQQAGWVDITPIKGLREIALLGIFPAWQNIGAQLLFLVPSSSLWCWWYLRNRIKSR